MTIESPKHIPIYPLDVEKTQNSEFLVLNCPPVT
jgi:hypothetical protein